MKKDSRIFVAGHNGLVGEAIKRTLIKNGYNNLILKDREDLDLTDQRAVQEFFEREKPEYVFLAAAKVGGIVANNSYPYDFIYENLMIESNVINYSHQNSVKKLLFLGSTCVYPKYSPQPMKEEHLLTSELEETNKPYAIAKIAGLEMCDSLYRQFGDNFISLMPTNLYGLNDNFDLETSHVLPAIMEKVHLAKKLNQDSVTLWGDGSPIREFLFVDDLAEACLFVMEEVDRNQVVSFMNVGSKFSISIKELAEMVKGIFNYKGDIIFDTSKPNGTPIKTTDYSVLKSLGWEAKTDLYSGISKIYEVRYKENR